MTPRFEIRHAHLFCGLGGGAAGFNQARPDIGTAAAEFRCIGGIDVDAAAIRDFDRIAGEIGRTLLLAWTGQTFALGSTPIWVRNVAVALTLPGEVRP
ncbi:hypothetical protein [Pseudoxanthomonas mexicana]